MSKYEAVEEIKDVETGEGFIRGNKVKIITTQNHTVEGDIAYIFSGSVDVKKSNGKIQNVFLSDIETMTKIVEQVWNFLTGGKELWCQKSR